MSVNKHWLRGQTFARNIKRSVDRETLLDLMGIVIYEADRAAKLEDAGFSDDASSVDCLFDYVLDALGVPPESESFSREPFEDLFYTDFWLDKAYDSAADALDALEALREDMLSRAENANAARQGFRVIDSDKGN